MLKNNVSQKFLCIYLGPIFTPAITNPVKNQNQLPIPMKKRIKCEPMKPVEINIILRKLP